MSLLRAVGPWGTVHSYERRAEFAAIAGANVERFFGGPHPAWRLTVGDLVEALDEPAPVDRAVLDMLASHASTVRDIVTKLAIRSVGYTELAPLVQRAAGTG